MRQFHKTIRCTPAMEAGVTDRLFSYEDLIAIVDEWDRENNPIKPRGSYKKISK
jgi:hypothetical protein